jgi:hypothetical protein
MSHRPLTNTSSLKITAAYCTGIIAPLPISRSVIASLPTESNSILNLFIAPFPTAVCSELKTADRAVCAIGN